MLHPQGSFESWVEEWTESLKTVHKLMGEEMPDDHTQLGTHLRIVDGWLATINSRLSDASYFLTRAKHMALVPRGDRAYTDLDRQTLQDDAVAAEQHMVDMLEGLAKAMTNRMILGMNLRRTNVGEQPRLQT